MKEQVLRLGLLAFVLTAAVACDDDAEAPQGDPSTVNVAVFVDNNANTTFDEGDDPIQGAEVTLTSNESEATFTATTSADGIATFTEVPAGIYTLEHAVTPPAGAVLASALTPTVVAQFEGGTTDAAFYYVYNPGDITGTLYRDENASGAYEPANDTTLAGFEVILVAGSDTTAENARIDSVTVGDDGTFAFNDVARGDYTLLVHPILGATLPDGPTYAATVQADATTNVDIEFEGGEAVLTVAQARGLELGTTVTVEAVVTAGVGVFDNNTAYVQDSTAGIVVDQFGADATVALQAGDSIRVTGTLDVFRQELRLENVDIEVLGTVDDLPEPRIVTAADVLAGDYQAELVTAMGVTIDSIGAPFGGNFNVRVSDATGSFIVFFDATTGIAPEFLELGATYNITGEMTRFEETLEIKPRSAEDLELTAVPTGTIPVALARIAEVGTQVTVQAVVSAGTGTFSSTTAYAQDETAGIVIDFYGGTAVDLVEGDTVEVTGTVDTFNDEERLEDVTVTILGSGTAPAPTIITGADLVAEKYQAELVTVADVEILSVGEGGSFNVTATDGTATFTVRIDSDTGLTQADFTVGSFYDITGIAAYFYGAQLQPRGAADVVASS